MIRAFVEESRVPDPRRIDWAGQAAVCCALFALTYALIEAGRSGWGSPRIFIAFALSICLAAAFLFAERHSRAPVLPPALFANPTFTICVAIGAVLNFGMYGALFIESLYLQNSRHLGALAAGLIILPFTALPTVTTRLIDYFRPGARIRPRLIIGQIVTAAGAATLALALSTPGYTLILLGFASLGIAMGCIMPAMTAGVLTASPTQTSGLASGILNSSRQVGGTLGVALMGTLVQIYHQPGIIASFAIMLIASLAMAATAARFIKSPAGQG